MFNIKLCQRHRYLHSFIGNVCPHLKTETPFPLLQAEDFGLNPDHSKIPLGFNKCQLSHFIKKLSNNDVANADIQEKVLRTLFDLLKDSAICLRAIAQYDIVFHLKLVLRQALSKPLKDAVIMLVCQNLALVSKYQRGALEILKDHPLFSILLELMRCSDEKLSMEASIVVANMTAFPTIAGRMLGMKYLYKIKTIINEFKIENEYLYHILAQLIVCSPDQALDYGYFDILLPKLCVANAYQPFVLKCFALLLQSPLSQSICDKSGVIKYLFNILEKEDLNETIYEYAALAMQNCTLSVASRIYLKMNLKNLPILLIRRAQSKDNSRLQVACLQTFRQITDNYFIKMEVQIHLEEIKHISPLSKKASYLKANLLSWLDFRQFDEYFEG